MIRLPVIFSFLSALSATAQIETLVLEPAPGMSRAELHYRATVVDPRAVLILLPGVNGDGRYLLQSHRWIGFAREHQLGLAVVSFASSHPDILNGVGYYSVVGGSGQLLLEGIERIYGRSLPLLLFGFSGGAQFTSRFAEWNPKGVVAWAAHSAAWWDEPVASKDSPPGIVACGDLDPRYGASLTYFKQGRAAAKPWLWLSLPRKGHEESNELNEFVSCYFAAILNQVRVDPVFVDIDTEALISEQQALAVPSLSGWMPSQAIFEQWKQLHEP